MAASKFIVLEGIDGAGTTTHTARLIKSLKRTRKVHATREPSDGPVGTLLRQILTGRVVVPGEQGSGPPCWQTMALLFGADRMDHLQAEIEPSLSDGYHVISDRYYHSTIAYQGVTANGAHSDAIQWLRETNRYARRPDLTLVLDVPPEVARERRRARSGSGEIFDDDALQSELAGFYREIDQHFLEENIVHVNADRDLDAVAADILLRVEELVAG